MQSSKSCPGPLQAGSECEQDQVESLPPSTREKLVWHLDLYLGDQMNLKSFQIHVPYKRLQSKVYLFEGAFVPKVG